MGSVRRVVVLWWDCIVMEEMAGRMGEIGELEFMALKTPNEGRGSRMNCLTVWMGGLGGAFFWQKLFCCYPLET